MATKRVRTLRYKLFLIIAIVYAAAILLEAVLYFQWYRMRRDIELNANMEVAKDVALSVHSFFVSLSHQQVALGQAIAEVAPFDAARVQQYLNGYAILYPRLEEISWLTPQGVVVASTNPERVGLNCGPAPFLESLQQGEEWSLSNLMSDVKPQRPAFCVTSAVRDASRNLVGMVSMWMLTEDIQRAFPKSRIPHDSQVTLYDGTGVIVWGFPGDVVVGTPMAGSDRLLSSALQGLEINCVSEGHFRALARINGTRWLSGTTRHFTSVLAPIRRNLFWNGLFMLLVGVLSVVVAHRMSKEILAGVNRLRQHTLALQAGDLSYRTPLLGLRELDELAEAFNEGTQTLEANLRHRADITAQLQSREAELQAANESLQQDIAFRNRAVAALREAEGRAHRRTQELEAVLNTVPAAVFIAQDPHCELVTGNAAAYKMFHVPEGTNLSKTPSELLEALPLKFYRAGIELTPEQLFLQQALATGGEVRNEETQIVYEDGTALTVYGHAAPYKDDEGQTIGAVAALVDITERKRDEDNLRRFAQELERSNQELERFAYIASHDLQEPLRMIVSYLSLLERRYAGQLDSQADEFIQFAMDGGIRMQQMVNDLLQYSRVQRSPVKLLPVDTNQALQTALINLKVLLEETGAEVEAERLPLVRGNAMQIVQVFQNLIGNSLKFHSPDRPLRIKVGARMEEGPSQGGPGMWQFHVEDNGIGIPEESLEAVFTIFSRLSARSKYPGSGIGLAICRKIIDKHGGRIWIESTPDENTVVYFTLPGSHEG